MTLFIQLTQPKLLSNLDFTSLTPAISVIGDFRSVCYPRQPSLASCKSLNNCNDLTQSHSKAPLPLREEDKACSVCMDLCVLQRVSH